MGNEHVLDISRAVKEIDKVASEHPQTCRTVSLDEIVKSCAKNRGEANCWSAVAYLLGAGDFSRFLVCNGPGEYYSILVSGKDPDTFPLMSTRLRLRVSPSDIGNRQIAVIHTHTFDTPTMSPADLEPLAAEMSKKTPYMMCLYTRDDGRVTCVTRTRDLNRDAFNKLLNKLQDCIDEAFNSERDKTLAYYEDSDFFITVPSGDIKDRLKACFDKTVGKEGARLGLLSLSFSIQK